MRRPAGHEKGGPGKIFPGPPRAAPPAGLEPATLRLTVECSAIELWRNIRSTSPCDGSLLYPEPIWTPNHQVIPQIDTVSAWLRTPTPWPGIARRTTPPGTSPSTGRSRLESRGRSTGRSPSGGFANLTPDTGCPAGSGLRSHPPNLIRLMPAEGCCHGHRPRSCILAVPPGLDRRLRHMRRRPGRANPAGAVHRRHRPHRRRRTAGRPEGVLRARRLRHGRGHRTGQPEHSGRP